MKKRIILFVLCFFVVVSLLPSRAAAIDSVSDDYMNFEGGKYYQELQAAKASSQGNQAEDIIRIAESQIGSCSQEYAIWCFGRYAGWCNAFVAWCANQAGISGSVVAGADKGMDDGAWTYGIWKMISLYTEWGRYYPYKSNCSNCEILPGDIIFANGYAHVGIVVDVSPTQIITVEGNLNGGYVLQNSYDRTTGYNNGNSLKISGYARPNYSTHTHNYSKYICTICGNWKQDSLQSSGSARGIMVVKNSEASKTTVQARTGPYSGCSSNAITLQNGTEVTVTGYVINAYGNKWYTTSMNGRTYYIYSPHLYTKQVEPESTLSLNCFLQNNTMKQGASNAIVGTLSSNYIMEVTVMVDGWQSAYYPCDAGSYSIKTSRINSCVPFSSLSVGTHTISISVLDTKGKTVSSDLTVTVTSPVAAPTFSSVRNVSGGKQVSLSCATSGATIYYTTDGSAPTTLSNRYTGPFTLTGSTTVRTIAVASGNTSSETRQTITIQKIGEPVISSQDIPEGARVTISAEAGAAIYYSIGSDYRMYQGPFTVNENTSVRAYAAKDGCISSSVSQADVTVSAPNTPAILSPSSGTKAACNSGIQLSWSREVNASGYILNVYLDSELIETKSITSANATVIADKVGTYSFSVSAYNDIGSSDDSDTIQVISMPPVSVRFVDWDGSLLAEQIIDYGSSATIPAQEPERIGYYFTGWSSSASSVKEDTVVKAQYRIKTFTVTFYDQNNSRLGNAQTVEYGSGAVIPDISSLNLPVGYAFLGWNIQPESYESKCDLNAIDSTMRVTAIIGWEDPELPIVITDVAAERNDDDSDGNYEVTVSLTNTPDSFTTALLRVSLKTAEGKMVKTESRTIGVKAGESGEYQFILKYDGTATQVEAVVLGYNGDTLTGSAYSEAKSAAVTVVSDYVFGDWSDWSTETPASLPGWTCVNGTWFDSTGSEVEVEEKSQYSYSVKSTTTSSNSALSGWTQNGYQWVQSGATTYYYYANFPSGYYTSDSYYTSYNKAKLYSYETTSSKRVVSEPVFNSYIYWHWTYPLGSYNSTTYDRPISDVYGDYTPYGSTTHWYAFETGTDYTYYSSLQCYKAQITAYAASSYWWFRLNTYRQSYTDYTKIYNYYKWSDYSEWIDGTKTATDTCSVKNRTVYRYRVKDIPLSSNLSGIEDTTGETYVFTNMSSYETASEEMIYYVPSALPSADTVDLSGKYATVMVYKGKNSDPNESQLQYVGQITIGENNEFFTSFKTKNAPDINTGDYVVCLSLQGSTGLVNIGIIEAPKELFTVKYYNGFDEAPVSIQSVPEGSNAEAPDAPTYEGYRFVAWSETGTSIRSDMDITAIYVPETYAVVFYDAINSTVLPFALEYGTDISDIADTLTPLAEGYTFQGWDYSGLNEKKVTGNAVITANYEAEVFTVNFYDSDKEGKQLVSSQQIAYGTSAELPDAPSYTDMVFLGWSTDKEWWCVTSNMDVYALAAYSTSTSEPIANREIFSVGMHDSISLSVDPNAIIYYTTDGSDPIPGENGEVYYEPITVTEDASIKAIAVEDRKNNSDIVEFFFSYYPGSDAQEDYDYINIGNYDAIVSPGDTVTLQVNIEDNPGLNAFLFHVQCDPEVFYLDYEEGAGLACTLGESTKDGTYFVSQCEDGWNVLWFSVEAATKDGTLFSLDLHVDVDASSGTYPISVSYSAKNMLDSEYIETECGCVGIISGAKIRGDINGDGELTLEDVVRILRHIVGLDVLSDLNSLNAADVNNDGAITVSDVLKLARKISGLEN